MKARHCTENDLIKALEIVNLKYDENVTFKSFERKGKQIQFTLRVIDSKGPGHRLGYIHQEGKQKRLACACWHVHGDFFEALFSVNPEAEVFSGISSLARGGSQSWISGNWQDRNIGSQMYPMMFSEACECN